jgi:predicted ATP-dependent endonuclease of OLD family
MIVEELRVLNYRSIRTQQTVPLRQGAVLVGPNNVGKSNLLRAVELFFNAAHTDAYDIETDLPYRTSGRTSLRATFTLEDEDAYLWEEYVSLHGFVGEQVAEEMKVQVYLEYSRAGNPSFKLFPNRKPERARQSEFSRRQQTFVQSVLGGFSVRYVPSAKDWDGFFKQFLVPALGEVVEAAISEQLDGVREALSEISTSLGDRLKTTLEENLALELGLAPDLSSLLGTVSIQLKDPTPTGLSGKGQGIQSAFLITAIGWISERERQAGRVPVWLLEEPEAYTHPALARAVVQLVDEARSHGPVVFTTHSLGLVPSNVSLVRGVERTPDGTVARTFSNHADATCPASRI